MLSGGMIGYALGASHRTPADHTVHLPQSTPAPAYDPPSYTPSYEPSYCPSPSYDSSPSWSNDSSPACGGYE